MATERRTQLAASATGHRSSNAGAPPHAVGSSPRKHEQMFALLVSAVRDYSIFMLDPDGRIASWNAGAERIRGWRSEEILGKHFSSFYRREDVEAGKPERLLREATQFGRVEDEGWRVRKDGTLFWADVVISPIYGADGKLLGYAKVTRDLTERRHAEERIRQSEERFRLLVESVSDYAIFMLDREGRVLTWNAGAERIKGYRASEIIGEHFSRFYPEDDVRTGKCEGELAGAERDGRFEDEGWRVRKDGSRFWANGVFTALRAPSGELRGFVKVTQDLTERRKAEDERLRLGQAEEAIRLRDEFLSIAAHELRTPLTALHLQLQSLRERVAALDEKIVGKVERAMESSGRLADLIDALLDVTRIASGRFTLRYQSFDIVESVRSVIERMRATAEDVGSDISFDAPGAIAGEWDTVRIEQVVTNLLSNALKYGAGGPVRVAITENDDVVVIEVSDRGPGIPEEDLPRIFGRFERAAPMRHYGGLGLGLYVAREIVEAHGGTVDGRNIVGGGASFLVRLPRRAEPLPRVPA